MFKKPSEIVTEKDVGAFVKELEKQGKEELDNFIFGEQDGLEIDSTQPTLRTEET